jgi:hypothetical protein
VDTIVIPRIVLRTFIQKHTEWLFLYGADFFNKGVLGQMWQCHGEPNAFPIYTCYKMCNSSSNKYWQDFMYDDTVLILEKCFNAIPKDERPIIPLRKIGEGHSRMNQFAPRLFAYMQKRLAEIAYPNIKIDWNS